MIVVDAMVTAQLSAIKFSGTERHQAGLG